MGGPGSGRWTRVAVKPLVEDQTKINIHEWQKQKLLMPDNFFEWNLWQNVGMYWPATVKIAKNTIIVTYELLSAKYKELITNYIELAYTDNISGMRTWFVCPKCCRRVVNLYLIKKYLYCRHCHSLGYLSQRCK